jgi:hypothetical protein
VLGECFFGGGFAELAEDELAAFLGDELVLFQPLDDAVGEASVWLQGVAADEPSAIGCPLDEVALRSVVHRDQEAVFLRGGILLGGGGLGLGDERRASGPCCR